MVREGWSWSGREANCAYLNLGDGSFLDISRVAGTDDADDGRAFAKVDWDNDGDLDMWVANRTAPQIRFLRNDVGNRSNFVEFQLTGTDVNRDAVGARVELLGDSQNLVRVLQAGTGFLSQSSNRLHFGTGDRTLIDEVLVRWPRWERRALSRRPDQPTVCDHARRRSPPPRRTFRSQREPLSI